MKYAIISPTGGFGNHLRWLLLLDSQYKFLFEFDSTTLEESYNNIKGSDWPKFNDAFKLDLNNEITELFNVNELKFLSKHKFDSLAGYTDASNKIEYIKNYVYPQSRTWHNWLSWEWKYRVLLDDQILFDHKIDQEHIKNFDKIIITTIDPALSLKAYIKFNSSLNWLSFDQYREFIESFNQSAEELSRNHKNVLLLNSGILFNNTLNCDLYSSAVSWFGLTNHYATAADIHSIWYHLHKKAETDMLQFLHTTFKGD